MNINTKWLAWGLLAVLATHAAGEAVASEPVKLVIPSKIAVDQTGNIYIADTNNSTVDLLTPDGRLSILAGAPGQVGAVEGKGKEARFFGPRGIAIRSDGTLFLADDNSSVIYKITPDGIASIFAGSPWEPTLAENVARIKTGKASGREYADGSGTKARFYSPEGIAIDSAGNIYVADMMNSIIRKITSNGKVTTLAGRPGVRGHEDGKGAAARFDSPVGIAVASSGIVYVTDLANSTVRKITPDGMVTTLAGEAGKHGNADGRGRNARFMALQDMAIDRNGNLYVVDSMNHNVRKITPEGEVVTVAGPRSKLPQLYFSLPTGIAVDGGGNIYISDNGQKIITKISASGVVSILIRTSE